MSFCKKIPPFQSGLGYRRTIPLWAFCAWIVLSISAFGQLPDPSRLVGWQNTGSLAKPRASYQVKDFLQAGGVADGVTPNDSIFKVVYAGVQHDSCIIYFPKGRYFFAKPINLSKPVILRGHSSDSTVLLFKPNALVDLIFSRGSKIKPDTQVLHDVPRGSTRIKPISTTGFLPGDYVDIEEDDSTLAISTWSFRKTGQINRIAAVSGDSLVLAYPLRRGYSASRKIRVQKVRMRTRVGLENFKIIRLDSTAGQSTNVEFSFAADCWVSCVESENCNFGHITMSGCTNIEVSGSYMHHSFGYGEGGRGYGVVVQAGSGQCQIRNNIFRHLRHSMLLQSGANGNVLAYNYADDPFWQQPGYPADFTGDLVLHGNYPYANLMEGNVVQNIIIDNSHGINGPDNVFFRNRAQRYGLFMSSINPSNQQIFIGNETTNLNPNMGSFSTFGDGHFLHGNQVTGTLLPPGTSNLPVNSLFLDTIPAYYQANSSWPPIGLPHAPSVHHIEAGWRDQVGMWTSCSRSLDSLTVQNQRPVPRSQFWVYPNPAGSRFWIEGKFKGPEPPFAELVSMQGARLKIKATLGSDHQLEFFVGKVVPGMYQLFVQDGEQVFSRRMVFLPE